MGTQWASSHLPTSCLQVQIQITQNKPNPIPSPTDSYQDSKLNVFLFLVIAIYVDDTRVIPRDETCPHTFPCLTICLPGIHICPVRLCKHFHFAFPCALSILLLFLIQINYPHCDGWRFTLYCYLVILRSDLNTQSMWHNKISIVVLLETNKENRVCGSRILLTGYKHVYSIMFFGFYDVQIELYYNKYIIL